MKALRDVASTDLRWSKPDLFRRLYELRSETDLVVVLRWEKALCSSALAESVDGRWILRRNGVFTRRVTLVREGSTSELASMTSRWGGGGIVHGPASRRYEWLKPSFWRSPWIFADESGRPVVRFEPECFGQGARVQVSPELRNHSDLPFLVTLGWYLLVLMADDGAVAAVAAAS